MSMSLRADSAQLQGGLLEHAWEALPSAMHEALNDVHAIISLRAGQLPHTPCDA